MINKEKYSNSDLYGFQVVLEMLKQDNYKFVSYRNKSIPNVGSPCKNINTLKISTNPKINKVICHKDNSITFKTDVCFLRFWK